MSSVYSRLFVHLVWATWNRRPVFDDRKARRVHGRLARLCHNFDSLALAVGGVDDHVHLLVALHPTVPVSVLVQGLKVSTSQFIAQKLAVAGFAWQEGYGVFSLRDTDCGIVHRYILLQRMHHAEGSTVPEWEKTGCDPAEAGSPLL